MSTAWSKYIIVSSLFYMTAHGTSLSEMGSNLSQSVSSWFSTTKTVTSSEEHPIQAESTITLKNYTGRITITSWKQPSLMIETKKKGGLEKLSTTEATLSIEDTNVSITTKKTTDEKALAIDYTLIVPEGASLTISNEKGDISIEGVHGALDVQTEHGALTLRDAHKSVKARAPHGSITLEQKKLPATDSIFLEAQGTINLILWPTINGALQAKTLSGKITSEAYVTLDPITTKLDRQFWKSIKQTIKGDIGSGGAPITLDSIKGSIHITLKK